MEKAPPPALGAEPAAALRHQLLWAQFSGLSVFCFNWSVLCFLVRCWSQPSPQQHWSQKSTGMNTWIFQHSRAGGFIHCTQWFSDMQLSLTVSAGLGKAVKGTEGELESAGGAGRRVSWHWRSGNTEWEKRSWMGGSGKGRQAGLGLCSGKQIPKVAWRGWLEEWMKCPGCESGVRMTQLGWGAVGLSHELTNQRRLRTKHGRPRCPSAAGTRRSPD